MAPVLPREIAQVMTMQVVVVCTAIGGACHMPWRVWAANVFDASLNCFLVVICLWASFYLDVEPDDRTDIAWFITISIIVAAVVLSCVVLYATSV
eukprot:3644709-Amphidinium_carterae.1